MSMFRHPDIEGLDRDAVLRLQRGKLAALGKRLGRDPHWVAHFAKAGMRPEDLAAQDGLRRAPPLEKADLRALYPFPLLSVDPANVQRFVATSGTTGLPVLFGLSANDCERLLPYQMARLLQACGLTSRDRLYQGYGYGLWIGGYALDIGAQAIGATNFPIGPGRGELVINWLRDHAYTAASMSPLWLMTLVALAKRGGIDPRRDWKLKIGILGGQSVSKAFNDQLEAELPEGFACRNIYGTTEAGGPVLAISTPFTHEDDEMQLLNEDTIITEILDPLTLAPVAPGEIGEVVITTLDKEASPTVKWRTRDLVRLSPKAYDCPSGRRGFPRIGRIIGRSDDMLKVRGVMVYPSQIEDIIASVGSTAKEAWQIYIDKDREALDEITIAVELSPSAGRSPQDLQGEIQRLVRARIGIRSSVECHPPGALPRYEAKAVRVITRAARPGPSSVDSR
jgi:phenylacetate-CoA ligase